MISTAKAKAKAKAKAETIRTLIDTVDHHSILDLETKFMYVDSEIS
jgi:hypothetical protein